VTKKKQILILFHNVSVIFRFEFDFESQTFILYVLYMERGVFICCISFFVSSSLKNRLQKVISERDGLQTQLKNERDERDLNKVSVCRIYRL